SDQPQAEAALRNAFLRKGMIQEAMQASIRVFRRRGDTEVAEVLLRGYDQGRYREAAREAVELLQARQRNGAFPRGIGPLYEIAGLPGKQIEFLEWAVQQPSPTLPQGVRYAA